MARATEVKRPRRGDVYLVNFDPTIGAEVKKTRPAVVIQNDIGNRWSPITIVAAMTSRIEDPLYPTARGPEGPDGEGGRPGPPPESRSGDGVKKDRVSR
jgi:mRNA interferase MazF